jgi:predicted nucleic acid-binding protein
MPKRLLDSNVLYPYYRTQRRSTLQPSLAIARQWAQEYAATIGYGVIATPIYLEFLCGVTDREEMKLAIAFLDGFENIDGGRVSEQDWHRAQNYAKRIRENRKTRQVTDCLIRAIADRLNCELLTNDRDLRRR